MSQELRDQTAAQLEAVAKRLRAGENIGGCGDLSATWSVCNGEDDPSPAISAAAARLEAGTAINDAGTWGDGTWPCEMHEVGWGLTVWVERARACDVRPSVCPECEGAKTVGPEDDTPCEDCAGSGEGVGDDDWICDYRLAPIPPNAVLLMHREGPDTIEENGGES